MIDTLVFSGGGINAFYFIGALETLINKKKINLDKIKHLLGCSVGSVIAFVLNLNYSIYFIKKLNIPPFAGRNDILKTTPLDINDANSVKIWLNELQYITEHYKNKYVNGNDNKIPDVTDGGGNLKAFLRRYI